MKPDTDIDLFSLYFHLHVFLEREINGTAEIIIGTRMVLLSYIQMNKSTVFF